MAFIDTVALENAEGQVRDMYDKLIDESGYLPAYGALFGHRPDLMRAWNRLNETVKSTMDLRRYEIATVAASLERRSSYCSLAHGERLLGLGTTREELAAFASGADGSGLDDEEKAVEAFARKVASNPISVTPADIEALRGHGLTDPEIFDVAAAAAARCFFTAINDALGANPDAYYRESIPDLVDVLAVGRPVAEGTSGDQSTGGVP